MDRIKIIVVDDDESWLKTFLLFLGGEPDLFIVGTASNKAGAIELVKTHNADIVLMDLNLDMQNFEGVAAIKEINRIKEMKVIVVTAYDMEQLMVQSFLAGAVYYHPKEKFKDIPHVIRQAHHNISPAQILLKEYNKLQKELVSQMLSPAENEVFGLLLKDYSLAQIGYQLNKAEGTVKNQVNAIFKKLNVKNRKQVIEKFAFISRFNYNSH